MWHQYVMPHAHPIGMNGADVCEEAWDKPEALFKAGIQGFPGCLLRLCITACHDWLDQLYKDITQLVLPEAVQRLQMQAAC